MLKKLLDFKKNKALVIVIQFEMRCIHRTTTNPLVISDNLVIKKRKTQGNHIYKNRNLKDEYAH